MSYRIQIELGQRAPLKEKILLHAKFLSHFKRRKLDADAKGQTRWSWEFSSESNGFTVIWSRRPQPGIVCSTGPNLRWQAERFMGFVVIKFSKRDIEVGQHHIVMGDWAAIEDEILKKERVA